MRRVATDFIRQYGCIVVEDLPDKNMSRSPKGTVENPGTKFRIKSGLNREITIQAWGILREQLRYKAEWAGK